MIEALRLRPDRASDLEPQTCRFEIPESDRLPIACGYGQTAERTCLRVADQAMEVALRVGAWAFEAVVGRGFRWKRP